MPPPRASPASMFQVYRPLDSSSWAASPVSNGIAFASRVGTSTSISGDGAELRIITAAILGGASLTGGKGTIWGTLIGVGFIALINNALITASVSAYWQSIITGAVLVVAVAMDRFMKKD